MSRALLTSASMTTMSIFGATFRTSSRTLLSWSTCRATSDSPAAPSRAKRSDISRPRPCEAPVMRMFLPASSLIPGIYFCFLAFAIRQSVGSVERKIAHARHKGVSQCDSSDQRTRIVDGRNRADATDKHFLRLPSRMYGVGIFSTVEVTNNHAKGVNNFTPARGNKQRRTMQGRRRCAGHYCEHSRARMVKLAEAPDLGFRNYRFQNDRFVSKKIDLRCENALFHDRGHVYDGRREILIRAQLLVHKPA